MDEDDGEGDKDRWCDEDREDEVDFVVVGSMVLSNPLLGGGINGPSAFLKALNRRVDVVDLLNSHLSVFGVLGVTVFAVAAEAETVVYEC